ncbi:hypothetical protein N9917_01360 [Deltaproteobacteria bacterium]|nr:hypothetical protein [Deltaproteobacteria bacterium]
MELMLVLAPYNQGVLDLLQNGGNVIATRITTEGEVPVEAVPELMAMVTDCAKKVDARLGTTGFTAKEAAAQANAHADGITVLGAPESLEAEVFKSVWTLIQTAVRDRSVEGKRHLMIEPFSNIPGKLHPAPIEITVMAKLGKNLTDRGYTDIDWDRRDGRVVLTFSW